MLNLYTNGNWTGKLIREKKFVCKQELDDI